MLNRLKPVYIIQYATIIRKHIIFCHNKYCCSTSITGLYYDNGQADNYLFVFFYI